MKRALVLFIISQQIKFEVPSFTDSKDMIGSQNLTNRPHDSEHNAN